MGINKVSNNMVNDSKVDLSVKRNSPHVYPPVSSFETFPVLRHPSLLPAQISLHTWPNIAPNLVTRFQVKLGNSR